MTTPALPLAGLRVLDFSNLLPGPLASLLLAEAGAEVIKVERLGGGDEMRGYPPAWDGASGNFALLNRGKTSLAADLKDEADRAHVRELARSADVLIEQFRPGVMARLGLGEDQLRADNPGLVYCSITGYGQTGERAHKAGHDLNYLAETGLLGLARASDGAPVLPPVLAADIGAGAYPAVINILLALAQRRTTGRGCHLDIAMGDNLFTFAYWGIASGQVAGRWPRPGGELTTGGSPRYRIYRTADGEYLAVAPIEERFWQTFCDRIGLDAADRDDRADPPATVAKVADRIAQRSAADWRERFGDADVCVSVVESLENAIADPAFAGRGLFDRFVRARGARMAALPVPLVDSLRDPARERAFPEFEPENRRKRWAARYGAGGAATVRPMNAAPYSPRRVAASTFVAVRGLRYHLNTWGEPRRGTPVLVMMHGWMDVGASFQFVVDALAAERCVIAPDWRGFGRTAAPAGCDAFWFPDYLGDLDALLDALSPDSPVDLAGHSMGGNVVMTYAGVRPQRVRRLIDLEGFGLPDTPADAAPKRLARWLDELKAPQRLRDFASLDDVADRLRRTNPRLRTDKAAWLATQWAEPDGHGRWRLRADPAHKRVNPVPYRADEAIAIWRAIEAPLLWVQGDHGGLDRHWGGRYSEAEFQQRLAAVPRVTQVRLADAGHMLHHDQPEALAAAIERHLA